MKLETFCYHNIKGWSVDEFPAIDSANTLVLIFSSPDYINHQVIKDLLDFYNLSKIIGCSTAGEIFQETVNDNSISVAVAKFEKTLLIPTQVHVKSAEESHTAGIEIANTLKKPDLKSILLLSDGLNVNGSELLKGINSIVDSSVVVTGGLAGDGGNFKKTWVIAKDMPQSNLIAAIGFYGNNFHISHGSEGGWEIFGPQRIITRSEGNIVYEIDKEPALDLYKQYLGERAAGLPATALLFPLAILAGANAKPLVRTILAIDEVEKSMTFAGDVPQEATVQLMRANFEKLIKGSAIAADMAKPVQIVNQPLAIAISCVGRRLILGERIDEELEASLKTLANNTQQVGFYSYGEMSPQNQGNFCELHNQTMTLTLIHED